MSAGWRSASYWDQPVQLSEGRWRWPQQQQRRSSWNFLLFMWWLRWRSRKGSTDWCVTNSGDPKSNNFGHAKKSQDMEHDTEICISQAVYSQVHKWERMTEWVQHRQYGQPGLVYGQVHNLNRYWCLYVYMRHQKQPRAPHHSIQH